ncbi:MAG: hypothetical protein ACTSU5_00735, partial [Promethearchaeota archaeon]
MRITRIRQRAQLRRASGLEKEVKATSARIFIEDRLYIQKMSKENREQLFVEVDQPELQKKIFMPLRNLHQNETHFFPRRFAILGNYKTGKTELGKYIIERLTSYFPNTIPLTVNAQAIQNKNIDEVLDAVYDAWYKSLLQVNLPGVRDVAIRVLDDFRMLHGINPQDYLDKIYAICEIYRGYLETHPDGKIIVQFDQANVIENEDQFIPFFEFWRNFQGFWEKDEYFSELPIFLFVIGHKNWRDFAQLKNSVGRGVFDEWVMYEYWNNSDIEELFKKRLQYSLREGYRDEVFSYFICNGLVDFFGKRLGVTSTQAYLDEFFKHLREFLENFPLNHESYENFLEFCKESSREQSYDTTYFQDIERVFSGNPALDYTPVFRFIGAHQNANWFEALFKLLKHLLEENFLPYKNLSKFKPLSKDFLSENFTFSTFTGAKPVYNPPLFTEVQDKIALNDTFRTCLEAIKGTKEKHTPVEILKRYIKSPRIARELFDQKRDGKEMEVLLNQISRSAIDIFQQVQTWVVNKEEGILDEDSPLPEDFKSKFYQIRQYAAQLQENYRGEDTYWSIFDKIGRGIAKYLTEETFPPESPIARHMDWGKLRAISSSVLSPETSNIEMARKINDILAEFFNQVKDFNEYLEAPPPEEKMLALIDGENVRLDLEALTKYTHQRDRNAKLRYYTQIPNDDKLLPSWAGLLRKISALGYEIAISHKNVDQKLQDEIVDCISPSKRPSLILLGTKDGDFAGVVKKARENDIR